MRKQITRFLYSAASVQWSESTHLYISELILTTYFSNNIFIAGNCSLSFLPLLQSLLLPESNNKSWLIIMCYICWKPTYTYFSSKLCQISYKASSSFLTLHVYLLAVYLLTCFLFQYYMYTCKYCCRNVNN